MDNQYDLAIIGAGPGGYIAAERAGHQGMKTIIFEQSHLGGVCLNEGCIPSKTLLKTAKLFHEIEESLEYGIQVKGFELDWVKLMDRKAKIIDTLRKGVAYQMKQNHVEVVHARASLQKDRTILANGQVFQGKRIIIATGSSPIRPPIPGIDLPHVGTSTEVFQLQKLPHQIVIIGGGVIGMEFACFFSSLGSKVSVIEMLDEILPPFDPELATGLRKVLKKVQFFLGSKVEKIEPDSVLFKDKGGKEQRIPADFVLLSVGRRPNVHEIGLDEVGIRYDNRGIYVDDQLQTNLPDIFAIGDVNGRSQLAHAASRMGEVVINNLIGRKDRMRYHAIPYVVYTNPEIAACGWTEAQAKQQGADPVTSKLMVQANGRSLCEASRPQGFVKIVVDRSTHRLLGVHMLGNFSSEIIATAAAMIEAEFQVRDIRDVVFAHPTVAEMVRDAAWNLEL